MARNAPSIREALEDAIEDDVPETTVVEDIPELDAHDKTPDEAIPAPDKEAPAEVPQPAQTELAAEHAQRQPAVREPKPPIDWNLGMKEQWKSTPPEVREWIAQRQHQVDVTLQESANARRFANEVVQTLEPYRAVMAAEGVQNPLQAIDGLMRITATLQMGSPAQKAQAISNLVKHYGIDIEALDSALVGQAPPPDPVQSRLEQLLEQKMGPVNQLLRQVEDARGYQEQQLYGTAHQSIEEFGADPRNEFFEHVRYDMGDLMEQASRRNRPMTLKQAYDICCASDPEIGAVVAQRNPAVIAQNKRRAASSLPASNSPGTASVKGGSVRDHLMAAIGDDDRI